MVGGGSPGVVCFEGAEKKIEIAFEEDQNNPRGLRRITLRQWQEEILDSIHCNIITSKSNDYFDAYVLSESSLFVYPFRVILKTCGTTTLLNSLGSLVDLACKYSLKPVFVFFSRKNFKFPEHQSFPHSSMSQEVAELNRFFSGDIYTFGPSSGDHWVMYYAEVNAGGNRVARQNNRTLEVLMENLDEGIMAQFFKNRSDFVSAEETFASSGLGDIFPGAVVDVFQFDPCGYSLNGLFDRYYFTIHITPEDDYSYVSFETNVSLPDYTELVSKVLRIFRPRRFFVSLFSGAHCSYTGAANSSSMNGFDSMALESSKFKRTYHTLANWTTFDNHFLNYASYVQLDKSIHKNDLYN